MPVPHDSIQQQHRLIGIPPKRRRFHPGAPTQLRNSLAVLIQLAGGDFIPLEDQLYLNVKLSPRKKSCKRPERPSRASPRKEIAVLGKRERTEPQPDAR